MRALIKHILMTVFLLLSLNARSQEFSTEADLIKHANELFKNEEFVKATSYFSQLLSLYPQDPEYNFKYGTCLLFFDQDKEKTLKYLEYAASKEEVDPEVLFYLGKAYHLNYRFANAIETYSKFISKASLRSKAKLQPERHIEMCNNGKMLVRNIMELAVMEKKEVKKNDFFRSYQLNNFGGKIISKPDEFKTSFDIKMGEKSIMFFPNNPKEIYFASYGESNKNGKDIFKVTKLPDGEWSNPKSLGEIINTPFDEDYPFMHPNGKTLYFCSKGHNSMGGYDIFKSSYDGDSDTWSSPVNLDFAICTPDEDLLFITDDEEKIAYFSSSRTSVEGNMTVYKINIEQTPEEFILITGRFFLNPEDQNLPVNIKIQRLEGDEVIGKFKTNPSGDYILKVPNGGRFKFSVEVGKYPVQTEIVDIPKQEEPNPLKQEMELVRNDPGVKLMIRNLFNEKITEEEYQKTIEFIKKQADLSVNYDEKLAQRLPQNDLNKIKDGNTVGTTSGKSNAKDNGNPENIDEGMSNEEIIKLANQDVETLRKQSKDLNKEAGFAFSYGGNKTTLSGQKQKEAERIKASELEKSKALKKEAEKLANEASVAFKMAEKSDKDAIRKKKEADLILQYIKELEAAENANSSSEARKKLKAQREQIQKSLSEKGSNSLVNDIRKQSEDKMKEAKKASALARQNATEAEELNGEIDRLEKEAAKTKGKSEKATMAEQIKTFKEERDKARKNETDYTDKAIKLEKEASSILNDVELIDRIFAEIQSTKGQFADLDENQRREVKDQLKVLELKTASEKFEEENMTNSGSGSENVTGNTNSANNTVPINSKERKILDENGNIINYTAGFIKQLEEAETSKTGSEKERIKAEITARWAESLSSEISYRKKQLDRMYGHDRRDEIKAIAELEQLLAEKNKEAENLLASAEILRKQERKQSNEEVLSESSKLHFEGVADFVERVEIINEKGEMVDYGSIYTDQLDRAELIEDEFKRERTKGEILSNWSASSSQEIYLRKEKLKNIKGVERNEEQMKIDRLSTYAITKQIKADEFLAKAKKIKQSRAQEEELALKSPDDNKTEMNPIKDLNKKDSIDEGNNSNQTIPEKVVGAEKTIADGSINDEEENESAKIDTESGNIKENIRPNAKGSYSSPEALASIHKAKALMNEANTLETQAGKIKADAASISNPDEKSVQIENARQLDLRAQQKKVNAVEILAEAEKMEYFANKNIIDKYIENDQQTNNDTIVTELLEEAGQYTRQAEQTRAKAFITEDPETKYDLFNKAIDLEKTAIDKQAKAIAFLTATQNNEGITEVENNEEISSKGLQGDIAEKEQINKQVANSSNNSLDKNSDIPEKGNINSETEKGTIPFINPDNETNKQILALRDQIKEEEEREALLIKEAEILEQESISSQSKADNTRKKKEKEVFLQEAAEMEKEAQVKRTEAATTLQSIKIKKQEEAALLNSLVDNAPLFKEEIRDAEPLPKSNDIATRNEMTDTITVTNINDGKSINKRGTNEALVDLKEEIKREEEREAILIKEAETLEQEASVLQSKAEYSKDKKEKAALGQEVSLKTKEAGYKRNEARVIFSNIESLREKVLQDSISDKSSQAKEESKQKSSLEHSYGADNPINAGTKDTISLSDVESERFVEEPKITNNTLIALQTEIKQEEERGALLFKEAESLDQKSETLKLKAENTHKKKEKEKFNSESAQLAREAGSKRNEAEKALALVRIKKEEETRLLSATKNNAAIQEQENIPLTKTPSKNAADSLNRTELTKNKAFDNEDNQIPNDQEVTQDKLIALRVEIKQEEEREVVLIKEAESLEQESVTYKSKAVETRKKKEKSELLEQAVQKSKEAEVKRAEAKTVLNNITYKKQEEIALLNSLKKETEKFERQSVAKPKEVPDENIVNKAGNNLTKPSNEVIAAKTPIESKETKNQLMALRGEIRQSEELGSGLIKQADQLRNESLILLSKAKNAINNESKTDLEQQAAKKSRESEIKKNEGEAALAVSRNKKQQEIVLLTSFTDSPAEKKRIEEINKQSFSPDKEVATKSLSKENLDILKEVEEFEHYNNLQTEASAKRELAADEFNKSNELAGLIKELLGRLEQLSDEADREKDPMLRKTKIEERDLYLEEARIYASKADSIYKSALKHEGEVVASQKKADQLLIGANSKKQENNESIAKQSILEKGISKERTPEKSAVQTGAVTGKISPEAKKIDDSNILTREIFDQSERVVYNSDNPIPIDALLPQGLVFKVQVGAFRNPISPDLFKGFAPIMGESTPYGFIRYTAGFFLSFNSADLAKEFIRKLGYKDAFVVAFYNGKRISVEEAQAMIQVNGDGKPEITNLNKDKAIDGTGLSKTFPKQKETPVRSLNDSSMQKESLAKEAKIFPDNIAPYQILNATQGLLYTIQIGVFVQPLVKEHLLNIQPLYAAEMPKGVLKYSSGIFNDFQKVNEAKVEIVKTGIKDAFVTAYYNGNRISIAEALKIEEEKGKTVFVQSPDINVFPVALNKAVVTAKDSANKFYQEKDSSKNKVLVTHEVLSSNVIIEEVKQEEKVMVLSEKKEIKKIDSDDDKTLPELVFRVQIGAFKEEVPVEIASLFLKVSHMGINYYVNEEGLTIYSIGNYTDYISANGMKNELTQAHGFKDAFIVAYKNQLKIPLHEALEFLKK